MEYKKRIRCNECKHFPQANLDDNRKIFPCTHYALCGFWGWDKYRDVVDRPFYEEREEPQQKKSKITFVTLKRE